MMKQQMLVEYGWRFLISTNTNEVFGLDAGDRWLKVTSRGDNCSPQEIGIWQCKASNTV